MLRVHARQEAGMWLPVGDHNIVHKLQMAKGLYDSDTVEQAMAYVTCFKRAIDAGAHIGMITKQFAGRFEEVISFEPDRNLFEYLGFNTQDIGNVRRFPLALGAETRRVRMSHAGVGHSSCGWVDPNSDPGRYWAFMVPLDSFGFSDVGLLKIDVEGFENDVIAGAAETINTCKPVVVIEENWCSTRYHQSVGSAREKLEGMGMAEVARIRFQGDSENVVMAWPKVELAA
jgi:FkbM family methyltransferase